MAILARPGSFGLSVVAGVLEATVLDAGAGRLSLLSGVEVVLVTVFLWSLARRLAREDAASWLAPILLAY